jgi:L-ascorbate metabolism protein UlaG (beta-lactamase superfamily)
VKSYRRAEGLRLRLSPCDLSTVRADVPHRGTRATLSRDEARIVARVATWQRADELGTTEAVLDSLVARDLLFFSDGRPARGLTCAALDELRGPVALRRNVWPEPFLTGDEAMDFMPRRRSLEGRQLLGLALTATEYDADVEIANVACCARHGAAARALLPRLDGRHTVEELASSDGAREVLEALDLAGLLERRSPPAWSPTEGVTWLGHAGVLYEAGGRRILVDPLFGAASLPARAGVATPPDWRDLGPIDAVLITHGDHDHLNPPTLLRIAPDTPIFIPSTERRMAYQVDLEAVLALCGFRDVRALDEWATARVGEVEITAAPFVGEDWGLDLPKRTWLVAHESLTVYCSADSAFMPEVYPRLAGRRIDLACLGVSGCAEPRLSGRPFGYGHFYEPWIPPERANEWIELCAGPSESARAAQLLGARCAFGYAAGGVPWVSLAYSDRGTHAELAEALRGTGVEPVELKVGVPWSR